MPGAERAIDMHAHALVPAVEELARGAEGRAREAAAQAGWTTEASVEQNRGLAVVYRPRLTQLSVRLEAMEAMRVDMQAVSIAPPQYSYWAEPELARAIVSAANEHIAGIVASEPDRFVGLGTVALQHPELAVQQLEHAVRNLGLRGVEVGTRAGELELADARLEPFWAKAEELGAVVFIHPMGCTLGERIAPYYLSNVIGNPTETTVALSLLIFGGVFDRYPRLKICAAHGGGYLPSYIARSDHAYAVRPESRTMAKPPSDYLKQIWFDSLVYSPVQLRHLIQQVGVGQVVLGTDYPYDMGVDDPLDRLAAVDGLSDADRETIRWRNAARLLGLE
jgi:aminocarboxymuconate-semialdehyde decarboxylase